MYFYIKGGIHKLRQNLDSLIKASRETIFGLEGANMKYAISSKITRRKKPRIAKSFLHKVSALFFEFERKSPLRGDFMFWLCYRFGAIDATDTYVRKHGLTSVKSEIII